MIKCELVAPDFIFVGKIALVDSLHALLQLVSDSVCHVPFCEISCVPFVQATDWLVNKHWDSLWKEIGSSCLPLWIDRLWLIYFHSGPEKQFFEPHCACSCSKVITASMKQRKDGNHWPTLFRTSLTNDLVLIRMISKETGKRMSGISSLPYSSSLWCSWYTPAHRRVSGRAYKLVWNWSVCILQI